MSTRDQYHGAERTLSLLGKSMLVAYIGFPLSLVLISWLGSPAGEKGPLDSLILLVALVSLLALLLCPVLIGVVAAKIGTGGIDLGWAVIPVLALRPAGGLLQNQVGRR